MGICRGNGLCLWGVGLWLLVGCLVAQIAAADESPMYERAREHMLRGEWESAIEVAGKVIDQDPSSADAYNLRGSAYVRCGDFEKARADIEAALRIDPEHPKANTNRSGLHYENGDIEAALVRHPASFFRYSSGNTRRASLLLKVQSIVALRRFRSRAQVAA